MNRWEQFSLVELRILAAALEAWQPPANDPRAGEDLRAEIRAALASRRMQPDFGIPVGE